VPVAIKRPVVITILAVLQFLGAAFWLLGGLGSLAGLTSDAGAAGAIFMLPMFLGIGVAQLLCGIGLLKLKPYGRTLQLVFAWIGLIAVPIGTIISVLILINLFKPGIKLIFAGRPGDDFTPEEAAQINADTASSGATTAIIIVVCVILGVVVLGIIAAISVPALLRARMTGNEVTAISSLRAIASAEVTYATTCAQGYAVSLEDLAKPASNGSRFIAPDLGRNGVEKSGYLFTVARDRSPNTVDAGTPASTCNGSTGQPASSYFAWAEPVDRGVTGVRYFAVDARGTVYESRQPISNPIMDSAGIEPVR
jgi:hypothetical protein